MELKITKEKVIEAAGKCSEAKNILTTLFPEVFEEDEPFIKHNGNGFSPSVVVVDSKKQKFIISIKGKRFSLSPFYSWKIEQSEYPVYSDGEHETFLVPTLK